MEALDENIEELVDLTNRAEISQYLNEETLAFLSQLDSVWDDIGIDMDLRKYRASSVIKHVTNLFKEILAEAVEEKSFLSKNIESLLKDLSRLGKELQLNVVDDVSGYENMPLHTVKKNLENQIEKYKEIHTERLNNVKSLISKEKLLCQALGRKQKLLPVSPLSASNDVIEFENYLENLELEKFNREHLYLKRKEEIIKIMSELRIEPSLDFERQVVKGEKILIKDEDMNLLDKFHCSLQRQLEDIRSKVTDLREKVNNLWERLEEPVETRSNFLKTYPGCNIVTYKALKEEEERCKEKIRTNIKVFIDKMRQEITDLWNKCLYSQKQKDECVYFNYDCYTEDLITLHELYIEKLKKYLEDNKPIYDLIEERKKLWHRMLELEQRAVNPERFKNRGGQLLREEKERNSVRAKLPKVEQNLLTLVKKYEEKHKVPFTIFGEYVTDIITNDWEQHKENRHLKLSAKKQVREQLTKTLLKSPACARNLLSVHSTNKTPNALITPKRKLAIPLFGSTAAKKNKAIPTIAINGSIINRRTSLERRKRRERRRKSRANKDKGSPQVVSNTTSYDVFEQMGIETKTACCSTLHADQLTNNNAGPSSYTPRTLHRTPSRSNLRAKSPSNLISRLTPAPGNLPIIL